MKLPPLFRINAFAPKEKMGAAAEPSTDADLWALDRSERRPMTFLEVPKAVDLRKWEDSRVGWGLIVPKDPNCKNADAAVLANYLDDPIQKLWRKRGSGPVFLYDAKRDRQESLALIWSARDQEDISLSGDTGNGPGMLPRYLLLYGSPEEIPWDIQYRLHQNPNCYVGRIPFRGQPAKNYIEAVCADFADAKPQRSTPLVWSPVWQDEGSEGITKIMHDMLAGPIYERMAADTDLKPVFLNSDQATSENLLQCLEDKRPALLITTSHGMTDPNTMKLSLGLPVDQTKTPLSLAALQSNRKLGGAIWYAHACCSAGSDRDTNFANLFPRDSSPDVIVKSVAANGSSVSPLPLALMDSENPIRAFIGHVEPTFNFSLTDPNTQKSTTAAIQESLYNGLYDGEPIGLAFRRSYEQILPMLGLYYESLKLYNASKTVEQYRDATPGMVWALLVANDRKTMVLFGDPAVTLAS